MPQLAGSACVSTQTPLQLVWPGAHWQLPSLHVLPPLQTVPQPPQLLLSVFRSLHWPEQFVLPGLQTQPPPTHIESVEQTVAHVPQWFGSLLVLVHTPLQLVWPAGQLHAPAVQTAPTAQVFPQAPQFFGSLVLLTQTPPHSVLPAGQEQAPATHDAPLPQETPHAPQLVASVPVSTHVVPQSFLPSGQPQTPAVQDSPGRQVLLHAPQFAVPWGTQPPLQNSVFVGQMQVPVTQLWPGAQESGQPPQCAASFCRSTQAPPQLVRPGGQVATQSLLLQTSLVLQSFAHAPQFFGSDKMLTQAPLHESSGGVHAHMPFWHGWPGPHVVPQAPQLSGLFVMSVQKPLQLICPVGHWLMHLPALQVSPVAQMFAHAPQLKRSVLVSTQLLPHCLRPVEQAPTHLADWHSWPPVQIFPQPPQFFGSLSRLSQVPSGHCISGALQPHIEFVHVVSALHAVVHLPQCFGSFTRSTQVPSQLVKPPLQVALHTPELQTLPAPHATPQPPQFAGSFAMFTHAEPHRSSVAAHVPPSGSKPGSGMHRFATQTYISGQGLSPTLPHSRTSVREQPAVQSTAAAPMKSRIRDFMSWGRGTG
jgi:hypothetical protein